MTSYRRNFVPGGTYVFTVNPQDRSRRLLTDHIDLLRSAFRDARNRHPYWERTIRDDDDFARHVEYIHLNPVKHGHAPDRASWPYSSVHRWDTHNRPMPGDSA